MDGLFPYIVDDLEKLFAYIMEDLFHSCWGTYFLTQWKTYSIAGGGPIPYLLENIFPYIMEDLFHTGWRTYSIAGEGPLL